MLAAFQAVASAVTSSENIVWAAYCRLLADFAILHRGHRVDANLDTFGTFFEPCLDHGHDEWYAPGCWSACPGGVYNVDDACPGGVYNDDD
eukprot:5947639-Karenia_brevis.AAC.1